MRLEKRVMYSDKENVNILTALLVEYGVEHVVVCPGSRNSALVHNFNECPEIVCHPVTDERSAAFVALGMRQQTGGLVAVCVTSGSALLNTLPGVAEASYQKCGIIVISADRPACWIDQLDGQTLPQPDALGRFVAKSVNLPECKDDDERWHCRRLVCEAMIALMGSGRSVLINVPLTEPLFNYNVPELPSVKPIIPLAWGNDMHEDMLMRMFSEAKRPMIVIGQLPRYYVQDDVLAELRKTIVVLSESLSSDEPSPHLDSLFSSIAGKEDYKPDFVLYLGGATISKRLRLFLRDIDDDAVVVMQNREMTIEDVSQHQGYLLIGEAPQILGELSVMLGELDTNVFYDRWNALLDEHKKISLHATDTLEAEAVKAFEARMTEDDNVFYANSSAIRLAARYAEHFVHCNRGLNGIEGSLSTAVGASLVADENVYCVIGDLSFFYDQNALWNTELKSNMRILLLNNGGGEIFKTLPGLSESPAVGYIAGQHPNTAVGACHQYGIARKAVSKKEDLETAMAWLTDEKANCARLVEVISPSLALPVREGK